MANVKVSTLELGDVVKLFDGAYSYGTVQQVTEHEVFIFRPYVHTADFSYTGGVMTYIGQETVRVWRGRTCEMS